MDGSKTAQFPGDTIAAYWILYVGRMSNTAALTALVYEDQIDLVWRKRKSWITGFHFFLGMPFLANSWIAPLWIAFQLTIVALTGTSATTVRLPLSIHPIRNSTPASWMYEYDVLSVLCFNDDFSCIVTILGKNVATLRSKVSGHAALGELSQPPRDLVARLVPHDPLSNAPARPWSPYWQS
ncbi:hypothetical protein EDD17DRAFT_1631989 [Pisolithus thermaeus]|nr:hypothetical protein EDD17DRAFT_1631989 [Pisolithus thermaeus]